MSCESRAEDRVAFLKQQLDTGAPSAYRNGSLFAHLDSFKSNDTRRLLPLMYLLMARFGERLSLLQSQGTTSAASQLDAQDMFTSDIETQAASQYGLKQNSNASHRPPRWGLGNSMGRGADSLEDRSRGTVIVNDLDTDSLGMPSSESGGVGGSGGPSEWFRAEGQGIGREAARSSGLMGVVEHLEDVVAQVLRGSHMQSIIDFEQRAFDLVEHAPQTGSRMGETPLSASRRHSDMGPRRPRAPTDVSAVSSVSSGGSVIPTPTDLLQLVWPAEYDRDSFVVFLDDLRSDVLRTCVPYG